MIRVILFITLCFVLCKKTTGTFLDKFSDDPDMHRNVSEVITSKGYPLEEHCVQTADGYLLSLQRIPYGRNSNSKNIKKDVVLLIHGILVDASVWVINFPNQSLGFILPDAGYDVWLINTRGCTYSRRHITYRTDETRFWNFSFQEVGQYDIPATINYILHATGEQNLYIIGHSQGTTGSFAMLCDLPEYNDKVKLFIALAPVATLGYTTSSGRVLVPFADEIAFVTEVLTSGEILSNKDFKFTRELICGIIAPSFCEILIFTAFGFDKRQLNKTRFGVYAAQYPAGTSAKSFKHYAQLVKSKKFRKFDYRRHNLEYYHQEDPPEYELPRITTPVALIWSTNDKIADTKDVDFIRRNLNSLVFDYQVPYPYSHQDFQLAENAHELIYKVVLQLLTQY